MLVLITLLTINMVTAAETNQTGTDYQDTTDDLTDDSSISSTDNNEIISETHDIKSADDLKNLFDNSNSMTGTHTIELNTENIVIEDEVIINNEDLELVFNGNGNKLTLKKDIFFMNSKVTFNHLVIELNKAIRNYADMYMNNVTIKNTDEYQNLVKIFQEKGYYDFNNQYNVEKTFNETSIPGMSIQNDKKLTINNSQFTNNAGHTGAAVYNTGELNINNTKFTDSIAKFGIIYTSGNANIENSEFTNNRVLQQLILTDKTATLTNNIYKNNYIAGSSIIDNRGNNTIKGNKFEENKALSNLIDNWGTILITGSTFNNNTCDPIINSFGNATITSCIFIDNNDNYSLITGNMMYEENSWNLYLIGNVNVTGNKIFANNITCPVFENTELGNFTATNNTIYGQLTDYPRCTLKENTFIKNNTLYNSNGEYNHEYYKEIYIDGNINYEITDEHTAQHHIILNFLPEEIVIGKIIYITGTLKYTDDTPIINHSITYQTIDETKNTITNEEGYFFFEYIQDTAGNYDIEIFETENPETINKITITVINNTTTEPEEPTTEPEEPTTEPEKPTSNLEDMTIITPDPISSPDPKTEPEEPTIKPNETNKEPEEPSIISEDSIQEQNDIINETEKPNITPEKQRPTKIYPNKKIQKTTTHTYKNHKSINTIKIKQGTTITLSWLNKILNTNLKNQIIQIYIGDKLIFNGTISEDSSQELFQIFEEFTGEQTLKVITNNKTYTKTINII